MMCLGLEPGEAGWMAQTNPLSYGGTPSRPYLKSMLFVNVGVRVLVVRHPVERLLVILFRTERSSDEEGLLRLRGRQQHRQD